MSDFEPARHTKMHEGMGRFGHDEPAGDTYYQESAGTSTYYWILKSSVDIPSYIEQKCISSQCEEATEVRGRRESDVFLQNTNERDFSEIPRSEAKEKRYHN